MPHRKVYVTRRPSLTIGPCSPVTPPHQVTHTKANSNGGNLGEVRGTVRDQHCPCLVSFVPGATSRGGLRHHCGAFHTKPGRADIFVTVGGLTVKFSCQEVDLAIEKIKIPPRPTLLPPCFCCCCGKKNLMKVTSSGSTVPP